MRRIFPYCYDVFLRSIKDRESIELKPFENTLEKNIEQALHTFQRKRSWSSNTLHVLDYNF